MGSFFRAKDANAAKNYIKTEWMQVHGGKIQCINSRSVRAPVLVLSLQASRRSNVTSLQVQLRILRLQTLPEHGGCDIVGRTKMDDIQDLKRGVWRVSGQPQCTLTLNTHSSCAYSRWLCR